MSALNYNCDICEKHYLHTEITCIFQIMKCLNVSAPSVKLDTVASSFMSVLFVLSILSVAVLYLVIIVFCLFSVKRNKVVLATIAFS